MPAAGKRLFFLIPGGHGESLISKLRYNVLGTVLIAQADGNQPIFLTEWRNKAGSVHRYKKERPDMDLNKMLNGKSARDQLLSYGDYFRSTDQPYFEITSSHYYKYSDTVSEFIDVLSNTEFLIDGLDWKAWIIENQLQSVDEHGRFIERASVEELRKLMTAYVRQERFWEGFLGEDG
ncbi:hypothetical protein ABD76_21735 [Paenibacillus dendritiformis]|nr:hypothetical protein [Paenibacillus dendritiformis]